MAGRALGAATDVGRKLTLPADEGAVSVWNDVSTLAVPLANRAQADDLEWMELGIGANRSVVDRDGYHAADTYRPFDALLRADVRKFGF